MSTANSSSALAGLASRLTNPEDRETYASLISYFESLPEDDELCRLAQLLGFVSLIGQKVPEAVGEFLKEFRTERANSVKYWSRLEQKLADLPGEITLGFDVQSITESVAEGFRQQLAATTLHETAMLLSSSVAEIRNLSDQIATALKPVPQQYKGIGATISADLARLESASVRLHDHNARLIRQQRQNSWLRKGLVSIVLFLIGVICGSIYERGQKDLPQSQIQRIHVQ